MEIEDILEEDLLSMMDEFNIPHTTTVKKNKEIVTPLTKEKVNTIDMEDNTLEQDIFEVPIETKLEKTKAKSVKQESFSNLDSSNIGDIAKLLQELLTNKTIEITIKIKDN